MKIIKNYKKPLITFLLLLFLSACAEENSVNSEQSSADSVSSVKHEPVSLNVNSTTVKDGVVSSLEFMLTNLDGEEVKASDYRGKWLVLNYWATWCAPCRDEMPELVKFQKENDHVQILGIAYEDTEIEKLKRFSADFNINYPLLTIDVYNPPKFAEEGGLGLPTTIVYNPEGMRHKKHMGPIDLEGLSEMIKD